MILDMNICVRIESPPLWCQGSQSRSLSFCHASTLSNVHSVQTGEPPVLGNSGLSPSCVHTSCLALIKNDPHQPSHHDQTVFVLKV